MDSKDPVHTMLVPNSDNSSCCHLAWSPTEFPSSNENVLKVEKDKPYLAWYGCIHMKIITTERNSFLITFLILKM